MARKRIKIPVFMWVQESELNQQAIYLDCEPCSVDKIYLPGLAMHKTAFLDMMVRRQRNIDDRYLCKVPKPKRFIDKRRFWPHAQCDIRL